MAHRSRTAHFLRLRDGLRRSRAVDAGGDASDKTRMLSDTSGAPMRFALPPAWVDLVDRTNDEQSVVKRKIKELEELHVQRLRVSFADEADTEHRIDITTQEITRLIRSCEGRIKRLGFAEPGESQESQRLRRNIQQNLAGELQELSRSLRTSQQAYLQRLRGQEELGKDTLLGDSSGPPPDGDGDDFDAYFDQGFTTIQLNKVDTHQESIAQRSEEIKHISESITDLAVVFKELATLVADQGTVLDRIDYNIEQVVMQTEDAVKEVVKADKYQRAGRLMYCIVLLLVLILILIVILIAKSV